MGRHSDDSTCLSVLSRGCTHMSPAESFAPDTEDTRRVVVVVVGLHYGLMAILEKSLMVKVVNMPPEHWLYFPVPVGSCLTLVVF